MKKPIGAIQSLIDFEYFRNIMKTPYCIYRLPIPAQFSTPLKLLRAGERGGESNPSLRCPTIAVRRWNQNISSTRPSKKRENTNPATSSEELYQRPTNLNLSELTKEGSTWRYGRHPKTYRGASNRSFWAFFNGLRPPRLTPRPEI